MKVRGPITTSHNPIKKSRPRTIIHLHTKGGKVPIKVCKTAGSGLARVRALFKHEYSAREIAEGPRVQRVMRQRNKT